MMPQKILPDGQTLTVRWLTRADVHKAAAISRRAAVTTPYRDALTETNILDMIRSPDGVLRAAVIGERLVGTLYGYKGVNYVELVDVEVDPNFNRLGIASFLIETYRDTLSSIEQLACDVNEENLPGLCLARKLKMQSVKFPTGRFVHDRLLRFTWMPKSLEVNSSAG